VVIAPSYDEEAIAILEEKKNRIILVQNEVSFTKKQVRTCLNGILVQDRKQITDNKEDLKTVTNNSPNFRGN
jgi:phosphoribosylaminoimidazolecarboxamide formyltransferase/IMP cyclohydrolase